MNRQFCTLLIAAILIINRSYGMEKQSKIEKAISEHAHKITEYLINQTDFEYKKSWSQTALHMAIEFHNTDIISKLIADAMQTKWQRYTITAIKNGNGEVISVLVKNLFNKKQPNREYINTKILIKKLYTTYKTIKEKIPKIIEKKLKRCTDAIKNHRSISHNDLAYTEVEKKLKSCVNAKENKYINYNNLLYVAKDNRQELVELFINYGAPAKKAIIILKEQALNNESVQPTLQIIRTAFIKREAAINRVWKKYGLSVDIANIIKKICRNEPV